MPRLRQVLPDIFFDTSMSHPDAAALLDIEVREVKLNTGSPCDGHAAMFANHKIFRHCFDSVLLHRILMHVMLFISVPCVCGLLFDI